MFYLLVLYYVLLRFVCVIWCCVVGEFCWLLIVGIGFVRLGLCCLLCFICLWETGFGCWVLWIYFDLILFLSCAVDLLCWFEWFCCFVVCLVLTRVVVADGCSLLCWVAFHYYLVLLILWVGLVSVVSGFNLRVCFVVGLMAVWFEFAWWLYLLLWFLVWCFFVLTWCLFAFMICLFYCRCSCWFVVHLHCL